MTNLTFTRAGCRRRTLILGTMAAAFGIFPTARGAEQQREADRAFLAWAIQIEIQQQDMGHMAERRAQTSDVRELGAYLVERHQQAQQRLQSLADQLNVPLSDKLSAVHLRVQQRYASIPTASFDKAFVRHEVGDYRYFLTHFETAARSGNEVIRQYAVSEMARLKEDQLRITVLMGRMHG